MTKEQLDKANELYRSINKINGIISDLRLGEVKLIKYASPNSYSFSWMDNIDNDIGKCLINHYENKLKCLKREFAGL